MRVSDVSISNKVISKISKAYKENPTRELGSQTEDLDEIYSNAQFDNVMQEFDRDFNRQRYAMLWVNQIDEMISFHSLKGFESFGIRNQKTGQMEVVVLNYPDTDITTNGSDNNDHIEQSLMESQNDTSAETEVYVMWTKDHHSVWIAEKKEKFIDVTNKPIEGNEGMINPLGVLPFVFISKSSSPDLPFLNQLTEQSVTYNILNSDLLSASALQGYAQLVITMPDDMSIETMHSGMTTAMTLPIVQGADSQPDAKYINPNPDLSGMKDTVENYARQVLSEHGIEVQSSDGKSSFNSGLERLLANADVSDQVSSNQSTYVKVEQEVVDILKAYGSLKDTGEELKVIFPKAKIMISDKETLENIEKRLDLGLITKAEALMIIDPNLTKEQAEEKLDLIKEEKEENLNSFVGGFNGQESNEETETRSFGSSSEE